MAILVGAVASLSAFYHDSLDITNTDHRELSALRMVAKMPTLCAMAINTQSVSRWYPQNI